MLFDEIVFMVESILDEALKQTKNRRKMGYMHENRFMCRGAYDLYLSIEEINSAMDLVLKHYFFEDYEVLCAGTLSFNTPREKWIYFTNEDFQKLSKTVVAFIRKARKYNHSFSGSSYLNSFFDCKNDWCDHFSKSYCAGKIRGERLHVNYLPWATPVEKIEWDPRAISYELNNTKYDISSPSKLQTLKVEVKHNIEKMEEIMQGLRDFMMKHCSLEGML